MVGGRDGASHGWPLMTQLPYSWVPYPIKTLFICTNTPLTCQKDVAKIKNNKGSKSKQK